MIDQLQNILANGEQELDRFCRELQEESLTIEFKQKSDPTMPKLNKIDKRNLGQALSGFSNSTGGLLIWGVDARPNSDGIDCAQELVPIHQIRLFKNNVDTLLGPYLMPRNEDVESFSIPARQQHDAGYLAVRVGASPRRPHRSEAPEDFRYYRRVHDAFVCMEHYEIEDRLRINTTAELAPSYYFPGGGIKSRNRYVARLVITLKNSSAITAKWPYMMVEKAEHMLESFFFGRNPPKDTCRPEYSLLRRRWQSRNSPGA